jgi:hypothetical protein
MKSFRYSVILAISIFSQGCEEQNEKHRHKSSGGADRRASAPAENLVHSESTTADFSARANCSLLATNQSNSSGIIDLSRELCPPITIQSTLQDLQDDLDDLEESLSEDDTSDESEQEDELEDLEDGLDDLEDDLNEIESNVAPLGGSK